MTTFKDHFSTRLVLICRSPLLIWIMEEITFFNISMQRMSAARAIIDLTAIITRTSPVGRHTARSQAASAQNVMSYNYPN